MILALGKGEHLRDIVEIDERLAHVENLRAEGLSLLLRRAHLSQPAPQRFIDDILEACIASTTQTLELYRNVIFKRQGSAHASRHNEVDALMSRTPGTRRVRPAPFPPK